MSYDKTDKAILKRFRELIREGERILATAHLVKKGTRRPGWVAGDPRTVDITAWEVEATNFLEWKANCCTLLNSIFSSSDEYHKTVWKEFWHLKNMKQHVQSGIAVLSAMQKDYKRGLLSNLTNNVETESSDDYIGQAKRIFQDHQAGYIQAAVLAGAVLERRLRLILANQNPSLSSDSKNLMALIDAVKQCEVFTETKAKELRSWADIRNRAAHGDYDKIEKGQVRRMIEGIKEFMH